MVPRFVEPLTIDSLADASHTLAARHPIFAAIVEAHGDPPLWAIEPGFSGLINIILGQQVSVASGRAAWNRLVEHIGPPSPVALLDLNDDTMLAIGFSRQKTGYARGIAQSIIEGSIDLSALSQQSDDDVRASLTQLRGIGPWSADIYLVMALLRPDVWPRGDLALINAAREKFPLAKDAADEAVAILAESWQPYRAVAARILWMDYLKQRGRPL